MDLKMRRARRADAAAIRAIDAAISEERRLEIGQRPLEYYEDWLACHDKHHPAFVGTSDGKVIWWAALDPCPGGYPFDGVALVGMGFPDHLEGTELVDLVLRVLEQYAVRLNYYKLIVCLDAQQRYLLHTYRRAGFRDVGTLRSQGYRKGKLLDMVLMERLLPADMEALKEHYIHYYDCYREYFEEESHRAAAEAQGEEYVLEYEEIATPEDQLPEGIVRFLRTKRTPDGQPIRHAVPTDPPVVEPDEDVPFEQTSPESQPSEPRKDPPGEESSPAAESSAETSAAPSSSAPAAVPAPPEEPPQLPEGIIRFLRSKRLPDGTLVNQDLPPVVPVKLSPMQMVRPSPEPDPVAEGPAAERKDGEE